MRDVPFQLSSFSLTIAFLLITFAGNTCFGQTVAERIGYADLVEEYGDSLPDGSGTVVALAEAFNGGQSGYLPNSASFPGKTIIDRGEPEEGMTSAVSGHATGSANNFFGSASSSPGSDNIDAYSAGFWLGSGGLNAGSSRDPLIDQPYQVTNHSYIITTTSDFGPVQATPLLQRLDFYIDRNDTLVVGGSSNGRSNNLPIGLVPSYNALAVGRTDGNHGAGPTTFYGEGRTKVDIVAPASTTSGATPIVSSVASLLVDAAAGNADAIHVETLKATLLAGATKDDVEDWDRTTTRPLDERYGAGQVNAYNSFKIQEGGQFEGSATLGSSTVGDLGWDYSDSLESSNPLSPERFYRFDVGNDQFLNEVSIALAWNIDVTDLRASRFSFDPSTDLVNLDLELFDAAGNIVDASLSTVDNVEHLHLTNLAPGVYDLKISGDGDSDFAIAWRLTGSALPGDFNLDQQVDAADIDLYSGSFNQPAEGDLAQLDLNLDGQVTFADHDLHITTLVQTSAGGFGTTIGDVNLDGKTDVLNDGFILVSNLGRTDNVGYADGDLNADGVVDVLNDAFRFVQGLSLQTVEQ